MNYAELSAMQASRSKTFSAAQIDAMIAYCQAEHDLKELQAENEKLRELVRHLRECTRHNVCAVCEYADDACDFDYDLRELGVEVDDG